MLFHSLLNIRAYIQSLLPGDTQKDLNRKGYSFQDNLNSIQLSKQPLSLHFSLLATKGLVNSTGKWKIKQWSFVEHWFNCIKTSLCMHVKE